MQSEIHEMLYKKLLAITAETRSALHEADPETLGNLAREQRSVMDELGRIGLSRDAALLGLVKEVRVQIQGVLSELRERHRRAGEELELQVAKRRQISAYRQVKRGDYR